MTQIVRSVFLIPDDRVQVIEFDPGNGVIPPSLRVYTFAHDTEGALYQQGHPVLLVGAPAAFLGRAWNLPL